MTADVADGWWLMGHQARRQGRGYHPPELRDPADPRRQAWINGYEDADHELFRKGQP